MISTPPRPVLRNVALLLLAGSLVLTSLGCDSKEKTSEIAQRDLPAPVFPQAQGKRSIFELTRGLTEESALAPSTGVLNTGKNRFAFAIFSKDNKQLSLPAVALYTATKEGVDLGGPYVARRESVAVKPQYQSRQTASDLQRGESFYVANVPFKKAGETIVFAIAQNENGNMVAVSGSKVAVRESTQSQPPKPGDKAIPIHTPTVNSVGGAIDKIDTRLPPLPDMHQDDLANLLGRKPVILLFATPQLCQSRVCGPVVDIAQQVKAETGGKVPFIHMEIYNENRVNKGFRPQVKAWRLPSEPWLFAINRQGKIQTRIEGAFSVSELKRVVQQLQR